MTKASHANELMLQLPQQSRGPVECLAKMYREKASEPTFFEQLVHICATEQGLQPAAAWLIKHHYRQGHRLPQQLTEALLACCPSVEAWPAKICLLQLIPQFDLTGQSLLHAEDMVRSCLKDSNAFVRAWAINGLHALIIYMPGLKAECMFLCKKAMETETSAVKSRVKRILAQMQD